MAKMIDHKAVARDILAVCVKHQLDPESALKVLIYTSTKLLAGHLKIDDKEATKLLEEATARFRTEIERAERMFKNQG